MKKTGRRIAEPFNQDDVITLTPKGDAEVRSLHMLAMAIKEGFICDMPQYLIDNFALPGIRGMLKDCETVEEQIDVLILAVAFFPALSTEWGNTTSECRTLAAQVARYLTHGELPPAAQTKE